MSGASGSTNFKSEIEKRNPNLGGQNQMSEKDRKIRQTREIGKARQQFAYSAYFAVKKLTPFCMRFRKQIQARKIQKALDSLAGLVWTLFCYKISGLFRISNFPL